MDINHKLVTILLIVDGLVYYLASNYNIDVVIYKHISLFLLSNLDNDQLQSTSELFLLPESLNANKGYYMNICIFLI